MLTKRQRECFDFICDTIQKEGIAPTYEEIGQHMGCKNKSSIHALVGHLEAKGYIRKLKHKNRAIEVLKRPDGPSEVEQLRTRVAELEGAMRTITVEKEDGETTTYMFENDIERICVSPDGVVSIDFKQSEPAITTADERGAVYEGEFDHQWTK